MKRMLGELRWTFRSWRRINCAIYNLLLSDGERSGASIGTFLCMSPTVLYPSLFRLEMTDLIMSRWDIGNPPRRRLYQVTLYRVTP